MLVSHFKSVAGNQNVQEIKEVDRAFTYTHTHTHTHIYIHMCVCVNVIYADFCRGHPVVFCLNFIDFFIHSDTT